MKIRRRTLIVMILAIALTAAFLTVRWLVFGQDNMTDNNFRPAPIPPPSTTAAP